MGFRLLLRWNYDFVTGALANKQAQKVVSNIVEKIKYYEENEYEIVFTKDTHFKDYMLTEEGKIFQFHIVLKIHQDGN